MEAQKVIFMKRALELAARGKGKVSPNPMVGCVIEKEGQIIGEGWHQKYGEAHAEVNAINSVEDKKLLQGANLYVNLEPCSHFGKTPPCADLILQYPFNEIVVANVDPFHAVQGRGIKKLVEHGLKVTTGVLEEEGRVLNERFFTFQEKKRPFIILKWAETADGFLARSDYNSKWISGEVSRMLVHKWRSEEGAIMVGTATAKYDNPSLSVRDWVGRNPVRVVVDRLLKLDAGLKVFDNSQPTLIINEQKDLIQLNTEWKKIEFNDVVQEIPEVLYRRNIQSVIIEGGSYLLQSFILNNMWDQGRIFKSKNNFIEGISAPLIDGVVMRREMIEEDELTWINRT